jgi:hypothetical protein
VILAMTAMVVMGERNFREEVSFHINSIEHALTEARPRGWRRAKQSELEILPSSLRASVAWRVDFPKGEINHSVVDHVFVAIDRDFPFSEPRVIAPQAAPSKAAQWPHVEAFGSLCLTNTRFSAPPGGRVLTKLQDALDLLDFDSRKVEVEFRREFLSYWSQGVLSGTPIGWSLITPQVEDRDIVFCTGRAGQILFADNELRLVEWMKNAGISGKSVYTTRLTWPKEILLPDQFPKLGRDVVRLVGRDNIGRHFRAGCALPLVLGFILDGSPIYAATIIKGASEKFLKKGFRPCSPRPARLVVLTCLDRVASPMSIQRMDAQWVHGRDVNPHLTHLSGRSVTIIGCGAIGGYLARGLAQAGVGKLSLIDPDELKPGNLGRHVLGGEWIGCAKVKALSAQIKRDFPHIMDVSEHRSEFQTLEECELSEISKSDLIVLAGVDVAAEFAVDRWVATLEEPPPRVWTWIEEFALSGHAIAFLGTERIADELDEDGVYLRRSTCGWKSTDVRVDERGCGVSFQPYDAVDMMSTVVMAQRLITDVLLAKISESTRRAWFGSRDSVIEYGGEPVDSFNRSFCEVSEPLSDG